MEHHIHHHKNHNNISYLIMEHHNHHHKNHNNISYLIMEHHNHPTHHNHHISWLRESFTFKGSDPSRNLLRKDDLWQLIQVLQRWRERSARA